MIPAQHFYDPATGEVSIIIVDPATGEHIALDVRQSTPRQADVESVEAVRSRIQDVEQTKAEPPPDEPVRLSRR